jgi:hypothetical protein
MAGWQLFLLAMVFGAGFELGRFGVLLAINAMMAVTKKKSPDGKTAQM